jgi:hypothetical protein
MTGVLDPDEYRANTDPMNRDSFPRHHGSGAKRQRQPPSEVTWASTPTRLYYVDKNHRHDERRGRLDGQRAGHRDSNPGATTVRAFADPAVPKRFFRVRACAPAGAVICSGGAVPRRSAAHRTAATSPQRHAGSCSIVAAGLCPAVGGPQGRRYIRIGRLTISP